MAETDYKSSIMQSPEAQDYYSLFEGSDIEENIEENIESNSLETKTDSSPDSLAGIV
ncbi:hypothetical protein KAI04_02715 [Candidatus Pacearchaeota archaeon]|nr:hypothetical protein [Candidatus Pacearchaeota archaeon]